MRHPKLCWSSRQDRHHVPAFQCLRDELAAGAASRSHD